MDTFRTRIRAQGLTVRAVALAAGTPEPYLHTILSGIRRPSVKLAKRIEAAVGGAIKWTEFFREPASVHPSTSLGMAG